MWGDADNWVRKVSGKLRKFIPKALLGTGRGEHQEDAGGWSERTSADTAPLSSVIQPRG